MHIRNAPTKLMKQLGYGKGYQYDHDAEGGIALGQTGFPDAMGERVYYAPTDRGLEGRMKEKLDALARRAFESAGRVRRQRRLMRRALASLPKTVWLLGAISLVNDAASDMIYPLVPLYVASVLMAGPKALGLIEGVAEAASSLLKLFSGALADRMRRIKPFVVVGYGLAGIARPLIGIATSWFGVLVFRFVDRVGKGLRSAPRDAMLAASVAPAQRGLAYGLHRGMDNAGAVIGPLIAAALLAAGFSLRQVFLLAFVPAVLVLFMALRLREPASAHVKSTGAHRLAVLGVARAVSALPVRARAVHARQCVEHVPAVARAGPGARREPDHLAVGVVLRGGGVRIDTVVGLVGSHRPQAPDPGGMGAATRCCTCCSASCRSTNTGCGCCSPRTAWSPR